MKKCILFFLAFQFIGIMHCISQQHHHNDLKDSLKLEKYLVKDLSKDYTYVDLTNASFRLPKYFEKYDQGDVFCYLHKATSSTIMAYGSSQASIDSSLAHVDVATFQEQGVTVTSVLDVVTNFSYVAKVFVMRFKVGNVDMNRIMFFTGVGNQTIVFVANFAEMFSPLLKNLFICSFMTVKFN